MAKEHAALAIGTLMLLPCSKQYPVQSPAKSANPDDLLCTSSTCCRTVMKAHFTFKHHQILELLLVMNHMFQPLLPHCVATPLQGQTAPSELPVNVSLLAYQADGL